MNLLFDRVYVINLKRRPDKLSRVMSELARHDILGAIPVEVIPGVDGKSEVNDEFLAANNYEIYNNWTDPWWGRSSLKGEIGCNIAHHKIWEKISELDENILVLEDDIVLENNFFNKCQQIAPQVQKLDFDFLYIGRKAIFPEKEERLTDLLLVPDYSYWTCAYVITPKGAKKLAEGGYEKKINVPTDEYLPYMYGAPHKSAKDIFDCPQNLKAYALIENLGDPHNEAFMDSETENSQPYQILEREDVKVFAFATEANDGLKMLYESGLKYGVPLEYAGLNEEWSGGNEARLDYPGGGQKVNILKNTIKDMVDDTLVIFTDGYDVLYNEGLDVILDKFKKFDTKVLFGAEASCWPDENLKDEYPETDSPLKFLNSGVIIGYVGELKKITAESIEDTEDDQLYYTKKYLSDEFDIKLDHKCEIIQNLSLFNEVQINKLKSKLQNTLFETIPCIIHGNGDVNVKMSLYRMFNYLINFKNHYGYTPVNEIEVNELPKVAYSINITEPPATLEESLNSLLDIDYDKEKIYLHLNMGNETELAVTHPVMEHLMSFGEFFYTENHKKSNILKENGFKEFLEQDIEYLFTIDSDCRIKNREILQKLIKNNKKCVSPLLRHNVSQFSNFWNGEKRDFKQNQTTGHKDSDVPDEYAAIWDGVLRGCFNVLFVDKCFLIKKDILPKIQDFYRKNNDGHPDKINFCANMINEGFHMYLDNQEEYGIIV
jgi:GR25 family glycosyltransferase involved in LPS biosynthesis